MGRAEAIAWTGAAGASGVVGHVGAVDTRGTAARCEIPVSSSRGEVVEASDGGQVLMNSRHCLQWSMRESSEMRRAAGKNDENCNIRTAGSMEATGMGLQDL